MKAFQHCCPENLAHGYGCGRLKVNFVKPAPVASVLEIRGRVKEIKGCKVIVETTVWVDGSATARGDGVAVQMPENFGA